MKLFVKYSLLLLVTINTLNDSILCMPSAMTKQLYEILYQDTHQKLTNKSIEIINSARDTLDTEQFKQFVNTYFYQNVFNQFFLETTPPDNYSCSVFWFALIRNQKVALAILEAALLRLSYEAFWLFINTRFDKSTILMYQIESHNNNLVRAMVDALSKRLEPKHFDGFLNAQNKEGKTAMQIASDMNNSIAKEILDQAIKWNNLRLALADSKKEQKLQREIRAYIKTENKEWRAKINQLSAKVIKLAQTLEDTLEVEALE